MPNSPQKSDDHDQEPSREMLFEKFLELEKRRLAVENKREDNAKLEIIASKESAEASIGLAKEEILLTREQNTQNFQFKSKIAKYVFISVSSAVLLFFAFTVLILLVKPEFFQAVLNFFYDILKVGAGVVAGIFVGKGITKETKQDKLEQNPVN